jgi:hypothetical protein
MSKKYSPKKLISRNNEQTITLTTTRQEYKDKILCQDYEKNLCRIRIRIRNNCKVESGSEKNYFRIHNTD